MRKYQETFELAYAGYLHCSLKEYGELCPCRPVRKSCYCLVNSVDEDTEKLAITKVMGGPTKDAWVSEDLLPH